MARLRCPSPCTTTTTTTTTTVTTPWVTVVVVGTGAGASEGLAQIRTSRNTHTRAKPAARGPPTPTATALRGPPRNVTRPHRHGPGPARSARRTGGAGPLSSHRRWSRRGPWLARPGPPRRETQQKLRERAWRALSPVGRYRCRVGGQGQQPPRGGHGRLREARQWLCQPRAAGRERGLAEALATGSARRLLRPRSSVRCSTKVCHAAHDP